MNNGFWDDLFAQKRPVVGLSPMDGVTDAAMRYMSAKYGSSYSRIAVKPYSQNEVIRENGFTDSLIHEGVDLLFTEFISVDALKHVKEEKSVDRVMRTFIRAQDVGPLERKPYEIAQVFGHTPELFYQAAVMIAELGYDGMDINMGCPMHKVEDQGSGAGLIRTPEVAKDIVRQAKQGMADWAEGKVSVDDLQVSDAVKNWVRLHSRSVGALHSGSVGDRSLLPVSVKTRIGVKEIVVEEWMEHLMEVSPANISLHGRTLKQLYQGEADWEAIGRAATVVHKHGGHILGNGDVISIQDGLDKVKLYGVDGFLIGRAAEGNPGIFSGGSEPGQEQRIEWMMEHAKIFEKIFPDNFMPMRKHLAWYCKGFEGASELRGKLVMSKSVEEVEEILERAI